MSEITTPARTDSIPLLSIDAVEAKYPDHGSLSSIVFSIRPRWHSKSNRPVLISIVTPAGELAYAADKEDLIAMRDWLNEAIAKEEGAA